MAQRSVMTMGASLLVASLALAGCGSRGDDTADSSGDKVVKIGVVAPLSGSLSALGLGIQHSVELAVKQANDSKAIPGWKLEVVAKDDEAKPDVGKNAATALSADKDIVGVVGTLNSGVAQQVQPILASANIVQVSPANTSPTLTQGENPNAKKRTYPTYFRTCTTDAIQGPFAAQYLLEKGIKKVATIHDKQTYGQGLVAAFAAEFTKGGGQIVAADTIVTQENGGNNDFTTVIGKIKPSAPEAIYYGGQYPEAGPLSLQLKNADLNVPLMGGDGIFDPKFVELAGKKNDGDLATSVGAPTDSTDAGKKFLSEYEAAGYKEPAAAYGGYAYDAAQSIIEALKTSLKDATTVEAARSATVAALGKVSFDGVTGKVAFDEFGDTTTRVLTVYTVKAGAFAAEKTGEFK